MDADLYDEFGNYVGPEIDSDDDDDDDMEEEEEVREKFEEDEEDVDRRDEDGEEMAVRIFRSYAQWLIKI